MFVEPDDLWIGKRRMSSEFSLTVCICTRNRPDDLRRSLESLAATTPKPQQVIVSDDSNEDQLARDLVEGFPFAQYQRGPGVGLGANRNACIARAKGRYISFIDDDVTVPSTYVADIARLSEEHASLAPRVILSGIEFKHTSAGTAAIEPGNADFWGYQRVPPRGQYRSLVINAAAFPAELFQNALFDGQLRYGSEEIDMARHAVSLGYTIIFDRSLHVDHWPSEINRGEYAGLIDASRMYATAKSYWQYEKSPAKALFFAVFAPLKLLVAKVRREGLKGLAQSWNSTAIAYRYAAKAISQQ